jgi:methylmalonyl-CoA mutase C-terminal domain/subunit
MTTGLRPIRLVMAKPGLDIHDAGVRLLCRLLRDHGMEVIYLGIRQTPEKIVETAIEEDVDVIGLSFHSLAHKKLTAKVMDLLKQRIVTDKMVIVGGSILKKDIPDFKAMGVAEVFPIETRVESIVAFLQENVKVH